MITLPNPKDSIAVVTGASSGIGAEIAIQLSKISDHIYIVGRNIEKLEKTNDNIIKNNCECTIVPLDLTKNGVLEEFARNVFQKNRKIDILVSSAGTIEHLSPIDSINEEQFKKVVELNYISNFKLIKSFHYLLKNSENGRLIVISSLAEKKGIQYWGIYQPIMNALNHLVITYAEENKNTKIKANVLCPKAVNTSFRDKIMPGENKEDILSVYTVAMKVIELTKKDLSETGKIFNI